MDSSLQIAYPQSKHFIPEFLQPIPNPHIEHEPPFGWGMVHNNTGSLTGVWAQPGRAESMMVIENI